MLSNAYRLLRRFGHDARGATAIEYALVAGGIAVAIIGAITALGATVGTTYNDVNAAMN